MSDPVDDGSSKAQQQERDVAKLMDIYGPEELDPEIANHLCDDSSFGQILHHPLYIAIPYWPELNKMINKTVRHKKEAIAKAEAEREWSHILGLTERPYRIEAFKRMEAGLTDDEYWNEVSWLWTDSENIHQNQKDWRRIWRSKRPGREDRVMDDDERAVLAALPASFEIYRGTHIHPKGLRGMSWTLDRDKAIWFARRLKPALATAYLVTGQVWKHNVLAFLDGRNEHEIVVLPERVRGTQVSTIPQLPVKKKGSLRDGTNNN